jgi:hypothetical protein
VSVLTEARKLIADPEHWLQGRYAETAGHLPVAPKDPKAVRFCSIGAVVHLLPPDALPEAEVRQLSAAVHELEPDWFSGFVKKDLCAARSDRCIAQYNDSHTHEEVLAVWDHAIAEEATP